MLLKAICRTLLYLLQEAPKTRMLEPDETKKLCSLFTALKADAKYDASEDTQLAYILNLLLVHFCSLPKYIKL